MVGSDGVKFRRAGATERRAALAEATLVCLARFGYHGTTVRRIAATANIAPGLLTHYFSGKDAVVLAAYRLMAERVLQSLEQAVARAGSAPAARLREFLAASFRQPSLDPVLLRVWVGYWSLVPTDPAMRALHREIYDRYRTLLASLVDAACRDGGGRLTKRQVENLAIGLSAMLDGLWLEWCLDPDTFSARRAARIARDLVERAAGIDLSG